MERSVRGILRTHFPAFSESHRLPLRIHRAAYQLSRCRTPALGGHIEGCPEDHVRRIVYHSCRHRLCPQCNALPTERWLEQMRARLLACPHHHIIFTIPHALHGLWRYHRAFMMQALFSAVAETLHTLCADERYVGAEPGFISALHTWGRSLSLHPHIHCLVSDGGLDPAGHWQRPKKSCFLPARVVMALFRGKLLAKLRTALARGALTLPPDTSAPRLRHQLNRLGRRKWNVHLCRRYAHGHGVMTYLARYVRGGPLKNPQLLHADRDHITFRYRAPDDTAAGGRRQHLALPPAAFLARYLQHVPLPQRPLVRHYGLYATRRRAALDRARAQYQQPPVAAQTPPALSAQTFYERRAGGPSAATHCPLCGRPLVVRAPLPRQRAPP